MEIVFAPELEKELKRIKSKNRELFSKIQNKLTLFEKNISYPSLRHHKLTKRKEEVWSISIDMSVRMLYVRENSNIYFFDIGTHEEVYGK